MEAKIKVALSTILRLGQGIFGAYAGVQILSALFSISRKNAQKKTEGIDHLITVAVCVLGVVLVEPLVQWLQAI